METKENTVKRFGLNFSEKQVSKPREHTGGKIDTVTGKPLLMRKLYIPSKDYRPKDVDLGIDSNGIDRNERKGYINIPAHNIYKDKNKQGRLFTYLSEDRTVKVNFSGEQTGRFVNGKPEYDSPEILEMSAKDFAHMYDGVERAKAKENVKEKASEKNKEQTKQNSIKKTSPER